MKALTGIEMIIEKLEEWEKYASKKINSCLEHSVGLKELIVRYRKV